MKVITSIFIVISINCSLLSQDIRYINTSKPVIESASVARDGSDIYHFYYTFNWQVDSSGYSTKLNPKITRILLYEFGASNSFFDAKPESSDSKNQIEFRIKKSNIDKYNQIQYAVKWEIDNSQGDRITKISDKKTLRLRFTDDPKLKVDIHDDKIYYTEDGKIIPTLKIKTNTDGTTIEELTLNLKQDPKSTVVAKYIDNGVRINSNTYTTIQLTPADNNINLTEGTTYYLYGKFNNNKKLNSSYPLPSQANNGFRLYQIEYPYIKPLATGGNKLSVQDQEAITVLLDASGKLEYVNAKVDMATYGYREYKLTPKDNDRWELFIKADPSIPYGTWPIIFSGMGKNGREMKETTFQYEKNRIFRKSLQIEYDQDTKVYKATAHFSSIPSSNVYLVIDKTDVQMTKDNSDNKKYHVEFSFDDATLTKIANNIKASDKDSKDIDFTTKIDTYPFPSYVVKNAVVIDISEVENSSKKDIKEYLEKIGFEDDVKALANSISSELKKNANERNWSSNVWASAVELAPKAIPIVLMLL